MDCSLTRPVKLRRRACACAVAMCQPAKLLLPTYRTLPCATAVCMACQISSHGVARSMWWNW